MADILKILTLMSFKKAKTNKEDPDQTASEETVWSGSSLFATLTSILWFLALITKILLENRKRSDQNFRTFTVR